MLETYRKIYSAPYNDRESIEEAKLILGELYRVGVKTWGEFIEFLGMCYD